MCVCFVQLARAPRRAAPDRSAILVGEARNQVNGDRFLTWRQFLLSLFPSLLQTQQVKDQLDELQLTPQ